MRVETKEQLDKLFKSQKEKAKNLSFNAYVNNILTEVIDYYEKLREYGAFLEYKKAFDDRILIEDHFISKPVIVSINSRAKQLYCEHDSSLGCIHVGFCYAIKEVYDVLISRGFRPPKTID